MVVATALSLWSNELLHGKLIPSKGSPPERPPLNLTWIFRSQNEKDAAYLVSRGVWPVPENWQPKMDFEQYALSLNGTGLSRNTRNSTPLEVQNLWITCAEQYEECACYGKIRWGVEGRWIYIAPSTPHATNRIMCEVGKQKGAPELIDVDQGNPAKHCECQASPAG